MPEPTAADTAFLLAAYHKLEQARIRALLAKRHALKIELANVEEELHGLGWKSQEEKRA